MPLLLSSSASLSLFSSSSLSSTSSLVSLPCVRTFLSSSAADSVFSAPWSGKEGLGDRGSRNFSAQPLGEKWEREKLFIKKCPLSNSIRRKEKEEEEEETKKLFLRHLFFARTLPKELFWSPPPPFSFAKSQSHKTEKEEHFVGEAESEKTSCWKSLVVDPRG